MFWEYRIGGVLYALGSINACMGVSYMGEGSVRGGVSYISASIVRLESINARVGVSYGGIVKSWWCVWGVSRASRVLYGGYRVRWNG